MTLDPRVEDNAKKIKQLKEAILALADSLDGIAWRVSSEEERKGIQIASEIRVMLKEKQK